MLKHRARTMSDVYSVLMLVAVPVLAVAAAGTVMISPALASGDANQASCPNAGSPGFRPYLADCRAYEQVTPVSTVGQLVEPYAVFEDTAHVAHVVVNSRGAIPGTGNNDGDLGSLFDLARGGSGWGVAPLAPSASLFPSTRTLDVSPTTGTALYQLRTASAPIELEEFYRREANGAFTRIGSTIPSETASGPPGGALEPWVANSGPRYSGASKDLTHVLFTLQNGSTEEPDHLWPGDTTVPSEAGTRFNSLYEYEGAGSREPRLVGVSGGVGSTSLISQCGTNIGYGEEAGGQSQDTYNAVSASGATIFFTAAGQSTTPRCPESAVAPPVNELFARVQGSRTVAISEPSVTDCSACDTSAPSGAIFQGASEDGSQVFFLSEQKLLPGAAGQSLYEYDFGAEPGKKVTLVAPEVMGVARVAEDGSRVYFVTEGRHLKVYQTASNTTFTVATLAEEDSADWRATDFRPVEATPDGRFLLFVSRADLTPDDTSTTPQLFRYDAQTGALVRVSIGQGGFNHNGNTESESEGTFGLLKHSNIYEIESKAAPPPMSMSNDGQYVFFDSTDGLTPQSSNNQVVREEFGEPVLADNVYEYHNGNVYSVSAGQDSSPTMRLIGTDASGLDVFLQTGEQLVPQDTNTGRDVYDARIGGGFPAAVMPAPCQGDGCQGSLSAVPTPLAPGSASQAGGGNLVAPASGRARPKTAAEIRARKLAQALKACKAKPRKQRHRCEAQARGRYGLKSKGRKASHQSSHFGGGRAQ